MGFLRVGVQLLLSLSLHQHMAAYVQATCAAVSVQSRSHKVRDELGPLLSDGAAIVLPSDDAWDELTARASGPRVHPNYLAIVEVATEGDVQNTIKLANKLDLPFLAVSGAHGWPWTINRVKDGIQISMRRMNQTTIHPDGNIATAGGGTMQHTFTSALWEQNKRAVTGICECVSTIGPLLGGGHSMLQAKHGFAADNLVSARLVLADGKAVTVSETENRDLFWAVRGAGHNFGIVTSFDVKAYDAKGSEWTIVSFVFSQDKLEDVFAAWNKLEDENPDRGLLLVNGIINRSPDTDPHHPIVNVLLMYEGENHSVDTFAAAFRALDPISDNTESKISWGDLYDIGGFGLESPVCRKNENILGYPNSFNRWDLAGLRRAYDVFAEITADETFATSTWLLESFGQAGVTAVPESANAVAPEERRRHLLTSPSFWWKGSDKDDANKVAWYGEKMQKTMRPKGGSGETAQPHSYVNYARGGESLGEIYGRDTGRLDRLRKLKGKWDPQNRFGFYAPIH